MRHLTPFLIIWIVACGSDTGGGLAPSGTTSGDYALEPIGGKNGYTSGGKVWQDSTVFHVLLLPDTVPVAGAIVHYRATAGGLVPEADTTGPDGTTLYVWRADVTHEFSGEVFACVVANDGCTEQRMIGFKFTPETH